jgi:hypothetical protein
MHVNTVLLPGATVRSAGLPWGCGADLPATQHQHIWEFQESLVIPGTVRGVIPDTPATERILRQSAWFAAHRRDRILGQSPRRRNG